MEFALPLVPEGSSGGEHGPPLNLEEQDMMPIQTILYPTDLSEHSDYVFRIACSLAQDHGARLIVLHVVVPPVAVYEGGLITPQFEAHEEQLRAKLKQLRGLAPKVGVELRLVEGDPVTTILHFADETSCDMIVMGTHGRTGLSRLLLGSVAEQVVRKAPCAVLTIKVPVLEVRPAQKLAEVGAGEGTEGRKQ
jgi:nucleotide-binding universal stress UspA family protein